MDLIPTDVHHAAVAYLGEYEPDLSRRVAELGADGGLFLDVGANAGYFTLIWLAANPGNRAVCREASPRNLALLREARVPPDPAGGGRRGDRPVPPPSRRPASQHGFAT